MDQFITLSVELTTMIVFVVTCNSKSTLPKKKKTKKSRLNFLKQLELNLGREGAGRGELVADEIAGGDVRDTEEFGEARGVGAFSDAWAAKENPLDWVAVVVVVLEEREGLWA